MQEQTFNLKPSNFLFYAYLILGLASASLVFLTKMAWFFKLAVMVFCLAYLKYLLERYVLLTHPRSIRKIKQSCEGAWSIELQEKSVFAELLGESTVTSLVSLLRFKTVDKVYSVLVYQDALPLPTYKQLIVAAKLRGPHPLQN